MLTCKDGSVTSNQSDLRAEYLTEVEGCGYGKGVVVWGSEATYSKAPNPSTNDPSVPSAPNDTPGKVTMTGPNNTTTNDEMEVEE